MKSSKPTAEALEEVGNFSQVSTRRKLKAADSAVSSTPYRGPAQNHLAFKELEDGRVIKGPFDGFSMEFQLLRSFLGVFCSENGLDPGRDACGDLPQRSWHS